MNTRNRKRRADRDESGEKSPSPGPSQQQNGTVSPSDFLAYTYDVPNHSRPTLCRIIGCMPIVHLCNDDQVEELDEEAANMDRGEDLNEIEHDHDYEKQRGGRVEVNEGENENGAVERNEEGNGEDSNSVEEMDSSEDDTDHDEIEEDQEQHQGNKPIWHKRSSPGDFRQRFLDCNMVFIGKCWDDCCLGDEYCFYAQESTMAAASIRFQEIIKDVREAGNKAMLYYDVGNHRCSAVQQSLAVIYHYKAPLRRLSEGSIRAVNKFAANFEVKPVKHAIKTLLTSNNSYSKAFVLELALQHGWVGQIDRLYKDASVAERDRALQNLDEKEVLPPRQIWKMFSKIANLERSDTSRRAPLPRPPS